MLARVDARADDTAEIAVIGSLARGGFGPHSDVDLLVRGPVDTATRVRVEQTVAAAMRGSGIPADIVCACDLTPERLKEFEHDLVEPSRLREALPALVAGIAALEADPTGRDPL
ncbi:nucleotidyltransferase domain-containing protein [Salinarimonas sp.]|uniref:nucleotidyltransferase domain-containing protein n=1 Tax=Salinarimonas sp. TaxID=2766526 RepID=UPI0032D94198